MIRNLQLHPTQASHMLCRLCALDKTLIEAHIIPRCLHGPLLDPSGPMMLVTNDRSSHPKRLQTGQYDTAILCADCDNKFSPWESYTAKLLMSEYGYNLYQYTKQNEDFYTINDFDYAKLKLCLLSILWKMSVSERPSYKQIALGPFKAIIRQTLMDENPGTQAEFPLFLVRLRDKIGSETLRGSQRRKLEGRNVYELGLPGYVAFIKVDSQPTPMPLGPRVLAPEKPLVIGIKDSNYTLPKIVDQFLRKSLPRLHWLGPS